MTEPIIRVRGLTVEFAGNPVLTGVDLAVAPGEAVAVVGENGTGKSTLLRCLAGLQTATSGTVDVFGAPPADDPPFWRQVALVADEPAWYPGLTTRDHLDMIQTIHPGKSEDSPAPSFTGASGGHDVDTMLEAFGLRDRGDVAPLNLSTGQRQRLTLASAFLRPSRLLLLDEPERGLDAAFRRRLHSMLDAYTTAGGTVVMATHDHTLAAPSTRRITLDAAR
ncbi:ABC transporter ATP-binding protein [Nonomuraea sp. NPDC046570]|uniref:ABC transporter ATP-binding protein n=1 Tax=Nonomuraea sp. NPDC046570 TaxID=3155255 RepID=UPI00340EF355